ncbi:MAG TPA: DJ-1/PfpI family protein [Polyangiaceae bacterium]
MRTKPYATSILVFDEVELLDVTGPMALLSAAGRQWNFQPFKLELVSAALGAVTTRSVVELTATRTFSTSGAVECLVIPGGYGARKAAEQHAVVDFVRRAASEAEFVLLIGNGALVAARAGLLDAGEIAVTPELAEELRTLGVSARLNAESGICASGKLLSAARSALALDLSCELVARTFGKKLASSLSGSLGVGWAGELEVVEIIGL